MFDGGYHSLKTEFVGELLKTGKIEWFAPGQLKYRHGSEVTNP
jgi:hypothetical protein